MGFKNSTYIKVLICWFYYDFIQSAMLLESNVFTPFSQKVEMFVQKWVYLESDFVPSAERIVSGKTGAKFIPGSKAIKNIFMNYCPYLSDKGPNSLHRGIYLISLLVSWSNS